MGVTDRRQASPLVPLHMHCRGLERERSTHKDQHGIFWEWFLGVKITRSPYLTVGAYQYFAVLL